MTIVGAWCGASRAKLFLVCNRPFTISLGLLCKHIKGQSPQNNEGRLEREKRMKLFIYFGRKRKLLNKERIII